MSSPPLSSKIQLLGAFVFSLEAVCAICWQWHAGYSSSLAYTLDNITYPFSIYATKRDQSIPNSTTSIIKNVCPNDEYRKRRKISSLQNYVNMLTCSSLGYHPQGVVLEIIIIIKPHFCTTFYNKFFYYKDFIF